MLNYENEKYIIHDTMVDNIEITSDGLILYFSQGIYCINHENDSVNLIPRCRMYISITKFDREVLYQHIEIIKLHKYTYKEISFASFIRAVNKNRFNVYLDYYSPFANSILIEGLSNNIKYYFKVSEVESIKFIFDR